MILVSLRFSFLFITFFFFNDTATTEIYTLSLHDALPIYILPWLNVTGRVRVDNTYTEAESRLHASGTGILYAGTYGNGIYNHSQGSDQQTYMEIGRASCRERV